VDFEFQEVEEVETVETVAAIVVVAEVAIVVVVEVVGKKEDNFLKMNPYYRYYIILKILHFRVLQKYLPADILEVK
ncbi:14196_t:CDS:2, partial [Funneliformis geosporum]